MGTRKRTHGGARQTGPANHSLMNVMPLFLADTSSQLLTRPFYSGRSEDQAQEDNPHLGQTICDLRFF